MANATTRAKRLNETKMILQQPLLLIAIILSFALLLLFVIYPLAKTLIYSLTDETGAFSLANLIAILQTPRYGKVFGRTMALGLIVAVIATFIGYVFAYTVTRVNIPGKGFFKTMATLPILSPPFVLSLSIIFLFGKQGLISKNLLGITGSSVYGMKSLIVVQVMSFFPIAYLTLSGILSSIDASVEDAACNMGAGRWKTFWTVTFPLSLPGIISGALLVFIQSLEDFSNPATIGGDYTTLSIEVYNIITGSYDMRKGSVLALLLLLPAVIAYLLNKYWVNKKSFVTVTGKPTQATKAHQRTPYQVAAVCFLPDRFRHHHPVLRHCDLRLLCPHMGRGLLPDAGSVPQGPSIRLGQPEELHDAGPDLRHHRRPAGHGHRLHHRQAELLRQALH